MKYHVTIGGKEVDVELEGAGTAAAIRVDGREVFIEAVSPGRPGGIAPGVEIVAGEGSRRLPITLLPAGTRAGEVRLLAGGRLLVARVESERDRLRALSRPPARRGGRVTARSTLPGIIRRILLRAGDPVGEGTPILTLEAMKMENEVRAEARGRIHAILVVEGQVVNGGDPLVEIET